MSDAIAYAPQNACFAAIFGRHSPMWKTRQMHPYVYYAKVGIDYKALYDVDDSRPTYHPQGTPVYRAESALVTFHASTAVFVGIAHDGIASNFDGISVQVSGFATIRGDVVADPSPVNVIGAECPPYGVAVCRDNGTTCVNPQPNSKHDPVWTRVNLVRDPLHPNKVPFKHTGGGPDPFRAQKRARR